jgi:MYXO-CTERM domain-containing protein
MVYDSARDTTVLFSGLGTQFGLADQDDTWELHQGTWTQVADAGPVAREQFGMAFDSVRNEVVLFGGVTHFNQSLGDTWLYFTDASVPAPDAGSSDAGVSGGSDAGASGGGKSGGCGCASSPPWLGVGALLLFGLARRRRRAGLQGAAGGSFV